MVVPDDLFRYLLPTSHGLFRTITANMRSTHVRQGRLDPQGIFINFFSIFDACTIPPS